MAESQPVTAGPTLIRQFLAFAYLALGTLDRKLLEDLYNAICKVLNNLSVLYKYL